MKTIRKTIGTKITRRVQVTEYAETPEEIVAALKRLSRKDGQHPFLEFLDGLSQDARKELEKRDLPTDPGVYWHNGNKWIRIEKDDEWPEGVTAYRYSAAVLNDHEQDSVPGYAVRFLDLIGELKDAVGKGQANYRVLEKAVRLGELLTESKFKFRYEDALWNTAQPVRAGAKAGGNERARIKKEQNHNRNINLAQEYQQFRLKYPSISETEAKTRVGKKHDLKRSAAIDAINNGLKILSGQPGKTDK